MTRTSDVSREAPAEEAVEPGLSAIELTDLKGTCISGVPSHFTPPPYCQIREKKGGKMTTVRISKIPENFPNQGEIRGGKMARGG